MDKECSILDVIAFFVYLLLGLVVFLLPFSIWMWSDIHHIFKGFFTIFLWVVILPYWFSKLDNYIP